MSSLKEKQIDLLEEEGEPSFYYDDVKKAVLDYELWCDIVEEADDYYLIHIWEEINNFEYPIKELSQYHKFVLINDSRLIYFQNEYDLKIGLDDKEKGYLNIFGEF